MTQSTQRKNRARRPGASRTGGPALPKRDPSFLVGLAEGFANEVKLGWALFNDPRVSKRAKTFWVTVIGVYLISPMGIAEDIATAGVGIADDMLVIAVATRVFAGFCPALVVREHRIRLGLLPPD